MAASPPDDGVATLVIVAPEIVPPVIAGVVTVGLVSVFAVKVCVESFRTTFASVNP